MLRRRAGHVAHADTPQTDLAQYVKEVLPIAIGFDTLLTRSLGHIRAHEQNYLSCNTSARSASIKIRSIRSVGAVRKEFIEGGRATVKVENCSGRPVPERYQQRFSTLDHMAAFERSKLPLWVVLRRSCFDLRAQRCRVATCLAGINHEIRIANIFRLPICFEKNASP